MRKNFKGISKRARTLLNLEENLEVEFKESVNGVKSEDLVSFANSSSGGTLFVGVKENTGSGDRQITEIVGCKVGDRSKMAIISKAMQCSPPITIVVILENENDKPFYRIEIPSGNSKPYCTPNGTYKIREDGRKTSLLPQDLLKLFMAEESGKFLIKFQESTKQLREEVQEQNNTLLTTLHDSMSNTESRMDELLDSLVEQFQISTREISISQEDIGHEVSNVNAEQESINDSLNHFQINTSADIKSISSDLRETELKVEALLNHFEIEDPFITRNRNLTKGLLQLIKQEINENEKPKLKVEELYNELSANKSVIASLFSFEEVWNMYNE